MKKITFLLLCMTWFSNAQIVDIPDANFKAALIEEGVDLNMDGEIQESEALIPTTLSLANLNISDLTGIEAFANLQNLSCQNNQLSTIDVSQNADLFSLICFNNQITSLDVSQNAALVSLNCSNNQLTTLDVSQNPLLELLYCNENQLTSIDITLNLALEGLQCHNNMFSGIDLTQNANLQQLICYENQLSSLDITQNVMLTDLRCNDNQLSDLNVTQNVQLSDLRCSSNLLNSLDVTQNVNLDTLLCDSNVLTNLDVTQNVNLIELNCSVNNLTTIDLTLNVLLETLRCSNNLLTSLDVSQNPNLDYLTCRSNQITSLDVSQNPLLESILCDDNQLASLVLGSNSIVDTLWCTDNLLTNLDVTQNTNLQSILCGNNQITSLDVTNNTGLQSLICYSNELTELNVSQNTLLESLRCFDNQLTTIDASANSNLTTLICSQNELTDLNIKNGSIETLLNFSDNPALLFVCADEEQVTSVQTDADITTVVSSYCSFTPGGDFNTITGAIIYDLNEDGCNAIDVPQPHIKINIADGSPDGIGSAFTSDNGMYTFYTNIGNFDISPDVEDPSWFDISPISATIPFVDNNNNVANQDFCITPVGIHNDLEIYIAPIDFARPGFDAVYQIVYRNKGNQVASGSFEFTYEDEVLDYVSATQTPDDQGEGSLLWDFTNLLPFENRSVYITLNVNDPTETPPVNIDDVLDFSALIQTDEEDEILSNNLFYYKQTVVGSFDPNDITCLQGDLLPTDEIGAYLSYVVNFENIGTFEAENVVIEIDVDQAQFDINTLRVLNASHMVDTRIKDNKVKFIFENINLAASGGHGNILIRVQSNANLQSGESVTKRANIHFDYNFPIETNDANTVFENLSVSDFETDSSVKIYPNPTNGLLNISANSTITTIEIFDVQGRVIQTSLVDDSEVKLNVNSFTNGIYFFRIKTEIGANVQKIIIN